MFIVITNDIPKICLSAVIKFNWFFESGGSAASIQLALGKPLPNGCLSCRAQPVKLAV